MRGFNARQGLGCAGSHFIGDVQIGPESRCGEEAGDHSIKARGHGRALAGEIGSDNPEMLPQLGQVPAIAAKDSDAHPRLHNGVDLAGDGKDQRGLTASVGSEDGDMLTGANGQVDVAEHDPIAAGNVDVFEFEKLVLIDRGRDIAIVLWQTIHIC